MTFGVETTLLEWKQPFWSGKTPLAKWVGPSQAQQAQVGGPKWVGPSWAQVGGPKPGPRGWAQAGPKWVGPSQKFGTQTNPKDKNSQNQNLFCPKCRQGFFTPEKGVPGPIWGPPGQFFAWAGKIKKNAEILLVFLGGPMGPIHPL